MKEKKNWFWMKKMESNDSVNSIFNSKVKKSLNFKFQTFHANFSILYEKKNFSYLFDEILDNKYEKEYEKNYFIKEFISFCDDEKKINETKLD